jgi:hypothetical protein
MRKRKQKKAEEERRAVWRQQQCDQTSQDASPLKAIDFSIAQKS